MEPTQQRQPSGNGTAGASDTIGELISRISDDVKVLARDEVELARTEIIQGAKRSAGDAAVILLGGLVACIGWGLLCVAAVAALEPVIAALWARLLLMAWVYMASGALAIWVFSQRLRRDLPRLDRTAHELKETSNVIRQEIHHA